MELIVISDLHLSVGYNDQTGRHSRNEDFFFDEEFKRFLEYLQKENSPKKHLIIAGDLFDFLQVDGDKVRELYEDGMMRKLKEEEAQESHEEEKKRESYKQWRGPFENEITKREKKYGLSTEQDKTVWKLGVIAKGHSVFFQALGNFLSAGNRLSIITGNHDIELFGEKVRKELVNRIVEFKNSQVTDQQIEGRIDFYPWFYYDKDYKTYIEHGNQYDTLNSFRYFLYPLLEHGSDKLWLPFGSFFVRYFFNKLETSNPFADNIKPMTKYMQWAWGEDKWQFLKNIFLYLPTMLQLFLKGGKLSRAQKKLLEKENDKKLDESAQKFGLPSDAIKNIYSLMASPLTRNKLSIILYFAGTFFPIITLIVFIVLFALSQFFRFSFWTALSSFALLIVPIAKWVLSKFFQKDPFEKILPKIKEHLEYAGIDVQTIVFGHTHDPDIRIVDPDLRYFNTGTWTTVFSEEERIIREAKQFAFVWIKEVRGKPQASLLRWNQNLNQPERLILFDQK